MVRACTHVPSTEHTLRQAGCGTRHLQGRLGPHLVWLKNLRTSLPVTSVAPSLSP